LPTIAINAMNKYYSFFTNSLQMELNRIMIVKILLMLVIVVCFLCILLLAYYLDQVNLKVVQVYSSFKLADVNEVLNKCNRFLCQRGFKANAVSKQRTSTIIKVIPNLKSVVQSPLSQPVALPASVISRREDEHNDVMTTEEPLITQSQEN
jgi:hypothetical protein